VTTWTQFMDMHSGGNSKEKWAYIYIEAPEDEARTIFYNRFGHNPERVSCTCCGEDYSITENESLEQATAYNRGCRFDKKTNSYVEKPSDQPWAKGYRTLAEYREDKLVHFIPAKQIKPEERKGTVPEQGYIWKE